MIRFVKILSRNVNLMERMDMKQERVCFKLCGTLCGCGDNQGNPPPAAGDGPRVLRAYFGDAGTYDWTAPDLANGAPYLAQVRLKGSGAGGESAFRSGTTYSGHGGGEGCLVECETMLMPGRTYRLTVGKGGKGGAISPQSGYGGNVNPVAGEPGQDTIFDELCAAPGGQKQLGGRRAVVEGSSEIVTPGHPGGARIVSPSPRTQVGGGAGGGHGGGMFIGLGALPNSHGVQGGGGGGGLGEYAASADAVVFSAGSNGGDGFIAIYTR